MSDGHTNVAAATRVILLHSCIAWMGEYILFGGESGDLHIWEASTLRELSRNKGHSGQ